MPPLSTLCASGPEIAALWTIGRCSERCPDAYEIVCVWPHGGAHGGRERHVRVRGGWGEGGVEEGELEEREWKAVGNG